MADSRSGLRSQIKRWAKSTNRLEPMEFYRPKTWEQKTGKKTRAALILCCDTKLRRALKRADQGRGTEADIEVMEEFSELVGDAGYRYKVTSTHIELHDMGINPSKQKDKTLKSRAKKAGRKIKKGAKSDIGRGAIGAGTGALLLGPIGAAAGAGIAMATRKKDKKTKRNPSKKVKLNSMMGNLLLDHHKVSKHVEHLATITLRGEEASLDQIRKARNDLITSAAATRKPADREQREDLAESLSRVLEKHSKGNPQSLGTAIKRQRLSKARSSASRATMASKSADAAQRMSLRKKLAQINPGDYVEQLPHMDEKALEAEHKAMTRLIGRAKQSPKTSKRMLADLTKIRQAIVDEKKRRRKSMRPSGRGMASRSSNPGNPTKLTKLPKGTKIKKLPPGKAKGAEPLTPYAHEYTEDYERRGSGQKGKGFISEGVAASYGSRVSSGLNPSKSSSKNPRRVGRKKGKFATVYTPSSDELKLLKKYNALEAIEGLDPKSIDIFIARLREIDGRRDKKVLRDSELDKAAETYRKRRDRHMHIVTAPGSTPGDVAKSKRRLDEAERNLALVADMRNMSPKDVRHYMESTRRKTRMANPGKHKHAKPSKGKNPQGSSKRIAHRGFEGVLSQGKRYRFEDSGYTITFFDREGDMVHQAYTPLPYNQAKAIFITSVDAHLDSGLPIDLTVPMSMRRMEQRPFKYRRANPPLGDVKASYKVRAQSLAAIAKTNGDYIENLLENMAQHGSSPELEEELQKARETHAALCKSIHDGAKLAKYGRKVKWNRDKLKKEAEKITSCSPERIGAMAAAGELKAYACISEMAEKMVA